MAKRTQSSDDEPQRQEAKTAASSDPDTRSGTSSGSAGRRRRRGRASSRAGRDASRRRRAGARAKPGGSRRTRSAPRARRVTPARRGRVKTRGTGRRFTPAERRAIIATARREGLTGAQVQKRFGVSQVSYYLWRKKAGQTTSRASRPARAAGRRGRGPDRPTGLSVVDLATEVRRQVRQQLARLVPEVVSGEMDQLFGLGRRGRSRRRSR